MKSFNIPTLLLGGGKTLYYVGGYTLRNVPRCWTYETSVILGQELNNDMPENEYRIYFAPDYKLHLPISNMENQNSKAYLEKTIQQIVENIGKCVNRPGVQIRVNGDDVIMGVI